MVYIAVHKEYDLPDLEGYCPLYVGAEGKSDIGYLPDNTGDHISSRNPNYCELTGLYWIWKNTNDDYKGLVHYRRFFSNKLDGKSVLAEKDISRILKKYDVILPFRRRLKCSVEEEYCEISGFQKDLDETRSIIEEIFPEYVSSFDRVMKGRNVYFFNMMIAGTEVFDSYCEWLFCILFRLEERIDLTGYNDYQKRIYGFLSERLLTVFFEYNRFRIFECGVIQPEVSWSPLKRAGISLKRTVMYYLQLFI